jgi:WD40 repeat protein
MTEEQRRVEIVHESLLTKWPRLVHWQTQDADGAQLRDELRQAAHLWQQHNHSEDFLWTGTAYREFQLWRERYSGNLPEVEEAFAEAMTAHAQRRRRRRQMAVAIVVAVAVAIGVTTTFLWRRSEVSRQRAESEARRATAAKLLAFGQLELDSYPTAGLAYATKSLEVADSAEGRQFAVKALWRGPTTFILPLPAGDWFQVRMSPDGKWLATSSANDTVLVFPSSGGRPLILRGHEATGNQRHTEFGPRSDLLITRAYLDPIRIWSIPDGKLLRQIDVKEDGRFVQRAGQVWMITDRPNSHLQTLRCWSLPDGPAVDMGPIDMTDVADFDIDSAGRWLVLARGHKVMVRSTEDIKERLVGTHSAKLRATVFAQNSKLVSRDVTGEIRVWSLEQMRPRLLRTIHGSASERSPQFDPTGSRVASADPTERVIRIWDLAAVSESEPLQLRRGDAARIEQLDVAARHGAWLAATNYTSISLWSLTRRYALAFRGHTNAVVKVQFPGNGSWIASASLDGTVRVWPLDEQAANESHVVVSQSAFIYGLAVDAAGKRILVGDTSGKALLATPTPDGRRPLRLEPGVVNAPWAAAFDHAGRRAALGNVYSSSPKDRVIRIWDVETGRVVKELDLLQGRPGRSLDPYDGGVRDIDFAPDGSLYAAGHGGVRHWDIEHGTAQSVLKGAFMRMRLSVDGRHLLTSTRTAPSVSTSVIQYHDLGTRTSRTLVSHGSDVVSMALDSTGTTAVTGSSDGTIRVGRITGEEPHLLFGHAGMVTSVAVSSDGRWIASGGADGTVRVWPMPDMSNPPLHTLAHDKLLAKLKSLTNLRVVEDANSPNGYKLEIGPFPGWEHVPVW